MPDKYQDEIEELLRGMGEKTPPRTKRDAPPPDDAPIVPTQPPGSTINRGRGMTWPSVSPGRLALIGLALLLLGSFSVLRPLIWIGLGFLVGAYLFYFVKPRPSKRWRGQDMEQDLTTWEKLRRRMKM